MKNIRFDEYRFQILPINRFEQSDLFEKYPSVTDLLKEKNNILQKILDLFPQNGRKYENIIIHLDDYSQPVSILRLAPNRPFIRENRDFKKDVIDNWPSFHIIINNDPNIQTILIEQRREAFQNTKIVANALTFIINEEMKKNNLRFYCEPIFKKEEFWKIIHRYEKEIREIQFDLITPNMANISASLKDDLKELAKSTGTAKTKLLLVSDPNNSLSVSEDNDSISSLVEYSSLGGGTIALRIKGIRRLVKTTKTPSTIEISGIEIIGKSKNDVLSVLRGLVS